MSIGETTATNGSLSGTGGLVNHCLTGRSISAANRHSEASHPCLRLCILPLVSLAFLSRSATGVIQENDNLIELMLEDFRKDYSAASTGN